MRSKIVSIIVNLFNVPINTIIAGIVSLFFQLGATLVYVTSQYVLSEDKKILTKFQINALRNISESFSPIIRVLSGYFIDKIGNIKLLLIILYIAPIIFKICFSISTLTHYIPIWICATIFCTAQFCDRVSNSAREPFMKMFLYLSSSNNNTDGEEKTLHSFCVKKIIGATGSIIGGIGAFYIVKYNFIKPTVLYFSSITFTLIGVIIMIYKITEVNSDNKAININLYSIFNIICISILATHSIKLIFDLDLINFLSDFRFTYLFSIKKTLISAISTRVPTQVAKLFDSSIRTFLLTHLQFLHYYYLDILFKSILSIQLIKIFKTFLFSFPSFVLIILSI